MRHRPCFVSGYGSPGVSAFLPFFPARYDPLPLFAHEYGPCLFLAWLVARFALRFVITTGMLHDPAISAALETYTRVSNRINKRIGAKLDSLCLDDIGMHSYK